MAGEPVMSVGCLLAIANAPSPAMQTLWNILTQTQGLSWQLCQHITWQLVLLLAKCLKLVIRESSYCLHASHHTLPHSCNGPASLVLRPHWARANWVVVEQWWSELYGFGGWSCSFWATSMLNSLSSGCSMLGTSLVVSAFPELEAMHFHHPLTPGILV